MLFADLKQGDLVIDTWYPLQGVGYVVKKFKRVVHIRFQGKLITYDRPHCRFLRPAP